MIFFIDTLSPCYYDPQNIDTAPLGAPEKCLLLIARYFAYTENNKVYFFEANKNPNTKKLGDTNGNLQFLQLEEINKFAPLSGLGVPQHIIMRGAQLLPQIYAMFGGTSSLYLVLDDLFTPEQFVNLGINIPVTLVCKSQWHLNNVKDGIFKTKMQHVSAVSIYNPIEIPFDTTLTSIKVDKNKLIFASSPHKGLGEAIAIFKILKQKLPKLRLYVANPGYKNHDHPKVDGVVYLDKLTPKNLNTHLSGSLCLFYPNFVYPETFGCICVEANALGVPIIGHPIGALPEVLINTKEYNQLIDCRNVDGIFEKILELKMLKKDRPVIKSKIKEFDLMVVGKQWSDLLKEKWHLKNDDLTIQRPLDFGGKKKVLMIRQTKIADAPQELANAINKYSTKYKADASCVPLDGYDILHYHNIYIPAHHKNKIVMFHSEPSRVLRKENFGNLSSENFGAFPKKELVISQYHATLREYSGCTIVRNVINFEDFLQGERTEQGEVLKIGFSPSTLGSGGYGDKGYEPTKIILERLQAENPLRFEFDIITGVSLEECIKRKANCDIIIDQCINPFSGFHRSGLEGLCLGKMTICCMTKEIENVLKNSSGSDINPFENKELKDLEKFLKTLKKEEVIEKGKKNKEHMIKFWHPKKIVEEFEKIYDELN